MVNKLKKLDEHRETPADLLSPEVFERAFRDCAPLARAAALRVLGDVDAAEDVVQEVFLGLWHRPERFDPRRASLETYVTMVARCRALDRIRSRSAASGAVQRLAEQELAMQVTEGPDEVALAREEARSAVRALAAVPEEQRRAVALRLIAGMSTSEVARRERSPAGTVKSRVRLGLAKARAELERAWGEPVPRRSARRQGPGEQALKRAA